MTTDAQLPPPQGLPCFADMGDDMSVKLRGEFRIRAHVVDFWRAYGTHICSAKYRLLDHLAICTTLTTSTTRLTQPAPPNPMPIHHPTLPHHQATQSPFPYLSARGSCQGDRDWRYCRNLQWTILKTGTQFTVHDVVYHVFQSIQASEIYKFNHAPKLTFKHTITLRFGFQM